MAGKLDGIDTIVVVMMENRSFDHLLGFLSHEAFDGRKDVNGLHQRSDDFDWDNPDKAAHLYQLTATADSWLPIDLPHSRTQIKEQLDSGGMTGFIKAYFDSQPNDRSPIPMRFCKPTDIPVTAELARKYAVCDRWHASLPDDTFPNRLMAMSGYTRIDSTSVIQPPLHLIPNQTTIFDWLDGKDKTFRLYVDAAPIQDVGPPTNLVLMESQWKHLLHVRTLESLAGEWGSDEAAPDVIYCEPFYNDFAMVLGMHGNCNHPPLPLAYGEAFLRNVYTALTSNPKKWARTMMVICYDEHGGFFDHVKPPAMPYKAPADGVWLDNTPFTTLGVRVPGIIVSPLVEAGACFTGLLDHTSILQLMVDKFGSSADLAFFGDAPARKTNHVGSLAQVLTRTDPRDDIVDLPAAPTMDAGSGTHGIASDLTRMFAAVIDDKPLTKI
jgi:phospholipase C